MIRINEITQQDRLASKILNGITGMVLTARNGMSFDDLSKNGLTHASLSAIIDFGISEGAFMPSFKLKHWLDDTKEFFSIVPPQNILIAIYKELQKYPQGSIKGYK